jgi:ATP phosphoribosyltransferase regulatory subunit
VDDKTRRLITPDGVKDLLPGVAGRKREVENRVQEVFSLFGYREVATPAFEYSSTFAGEMNGDLEGKLYRFLDERGRTMALRPDFTFPLARLAATHLSGGAGPLRLCYSGSVWRYATSQQGRQREIAQAGVELIGSGSAAADAEVAALAVESLLAAGLAEFTVCLGHVGFLQSLLAAHGVTGEPGERVKGYFNRKDFVSLKEYVAALPLAGHPRRCILGVTALRGGRDVLDSAAALLPPGTGRDSLERLDEIRLMLGEYGVGEFITFDLGLVRSLDYYTGMVFEGYTAGLGFPVLGGGRYDRLLGLFGRDLPAVGFGLNLDHLLSVLERRGCFDRAGEPVFACYGEGGREAAVQEARNLRREGRPVILDVEARSREEAQAEAEKRGAAAMVYCTPEGGWTGNE